MSKSVSNVIIEPKTAFPLLWASHLIWMLSFIFSKLVVVWELNRVLAFLAACQPLFLIKKKTPWTSFYSCSTFVHAWQTQDTSLVDVFPEQMWTCQVCVLSLQVQVFKVKSQREVKENLASLFNRAICLKTCKIQINLLYELCSELDSAILLNWWFHLDFFWPLTRGLQVLKVRESLKSFQFIQVELPP